MLRGFNKTSDSSPISDFLDQYGFEPYEYEVEYGYWAELYIDKAMFEKMLLSPAPPTGKSDFVDGVDQFGDSSVRLSEELPSIDKIENKF